MVRLRGHHLICLRFYRGEGYSREFVENLEDVLRRAKEGEEIEVVEGADDICRACPTLRGGKCVSAPEADTEIRKMDGQAAAHLGVPAGSKVLWQDIQAQVTATPGEWLAAFCEDCQWEEVCAEIKARLGLV
ncbi:MAG: DUF1284 domain-containing protein [Candidatus Desulforudis sp.]|nr:DUF1284 domain-containing protein [Desulforudis sp.]